MSYEGFWKMVKEKSNDSAATKVVDSKALAFAKDWEAGKGLLDASQSPSPVSLSSTHAYLTGARLQLKNSSRLKTLSSRPAKPNTNSSMVSLATILTVKRSSNISVVDLRTRDSLATALSHIDGKRSPWIFRSAAMRRA
jgi:hypothetical protein